MVGSVLIAYDDGFDIKELYYNNISFNKEEY